MADWQTPAEREQMQRLSNYWTARRHIHAVYQQSLENLRADYADVSGFGEVEDPFTHPEQLRLPIDKEEQ